MAMHEEANFTVVAWGVNGGYAGQGAHVQAMLSNMPWRSVYHRRVDGGGIPATPAVSPQGCSVGTLEDLMQVVNIAMRVEGMACVP